MTHGVSWCATLVPVNDTPNDTPTTQMRTPEPCFRCEKLVRPAARVWHYHFIDAGGLDLGWYPVGSDCAKAIRAEGGEVERWEVTR